MEEKIVVQKIRKEYESKMDIALKYYHIISILNNLDLTKRQIELLAHTAVRGNISSITSKEEFIRLNKTSKATINNMISELYHMGLLIKANGKTMVLPLIKLDFSKSDFVFQLNLTAKQDADQQANTPNNA